MPIKHLSRTKKPTPISSNKLGIKPVSFGEKRTEQAEPIDYSKYTADEVRELKQMSNQAKVFTARLIDEAKALRQTKENLYLQHEEAYLLDPGFKETQSIIWQAQTEATFLTASVIEQLPVLFEANPSIIESIKKNDN